MNLDKFKELSFKEKLQWIWDYYAVTIAVALVVVIVLVILVSSMLGLRGNQSALNVVILDDRMNDEASEKMKEEWSSIVDGNVEISFFSKHDVEQFQAFIVRVAVDGTDIVIAPYEEISEMAANGYIKDNYYLLSDDSFYSELLNIGDMFDKYDDVYLGEACRGANADNSALIYKRYSNE